MHAKASKMACNLIKIDIKTEVAMCVSYKIALFIDMSENK
jgi:hypothetical protein